MTRYGRFVGDSNDQIGTANTLLSTVDDLGERLPGTPYRLIDRIGAGGMGQVYRGLHIELGREVAIKLLLPSLLVRQA